MQSSARNPIKHKFSNKSRDSSNAPMKGRTCAFWPTVKLAVEKLIPFMGINKSMASPP